MKIHCELRWELYLVKRFGAICDDVINWKDGLVQPQVEIRYCMNVIGNWRIEQVNQAQGHRKISIVHAGMKI